MTPSCHRGWGGPIGKALIRSCPEDFRVTEELGFEPSGEGEHAFLYLQKRELNTMDLAERLTRISGVAQRDIGYSGLKDRNAVTQQWFSVGLAGRAEPDWQALAAEGDVEVLAVQRHTRKLRRGVHRANGFSLVLRQIEGNREELEQRLAHIRDFGVPNYFGEQRFGRNASTLEQAERWIRGARKISRRKRSLFLSALRSQLFNQLLSARVQAGTWNTVLSGDTCVLRGSRSFFAAGEVDEALVARAASGDIHAGMPLWGRGWSEPTRPFRAWAEGELAEQLSHCRFLEEAGLGLAWRPARVFADDFCWQFCDDGSLQLNFALGAGSYATALLAEFVQYEKGNLESGIGSEQG